MRSALQMYGVALAGALQDDPGTGASPGPRIRFEHGPLMALPVGRYVGPTDHTDERLLDEIVGPVLDVGCGPGRHLRALTHRGVFALGVDLSPVAVGLARGGGARAIVGDVFDELPGAGTWRTALLLDGNVGIGGCPRDYCDACARCCMRRDGYWSSSKHPERNHLIRGSGLRTMGR